MGTLVDDARPDPALAIADRHYTVSVPGPIYVVARESHGNWVFPRCRGATGSWLSLIWERRYGLFYDGFPDCEQASCNADQRNRNPMPSADESPETPGVRTAAGHVMLLRSSKAIGCTAG